ncbi:MAG: aldehyde-activating protein [Alcanivoracaceae bacterium]|uniref:GFA family protein n=1 Tax=Alcanivorax sp. MD8A TaxID=1177157 RepID=UPI000C3607E0|nr:GFA family protein [Alcanivorax sp. MD8A]MAX56594.1 aldehyde-activating protein [Alcanivoracaceae bacterium]MCG8439938.1 GFA family protein [Pseudomonadales bacterium]MED5431143.1 GFA family protein [Pseudomonadota bacterium]
MPNVNPMSGRCLCGEVSLTATPKSLHVGACHCDMCRQWGGGPLLAVECEESVQWFGEEKVAVFGSSDWAERGFCRECGTHLFYRLREGGHTAIPVGLFQECENWQLTEQVFIDRKPPFYSFAEQTRNLTGEALFALFSADEHSPDSTDH